ncbi:MAG: zinc ABC transporter substrate-binding protein, partial [Marinobacter sp.]
MNAHLRLPRAAIVTGLLTLAAALPAAAETNIVTSIKPLELLVRAVATDNVTVTSLVAPGGSPHNYTLRPSQRRALEQANAIFWVGPDVESFLTRLLANNEFSGRTHQLMGQTDNHNEEAPHAEDDQSREHTDHNEHQANEEKHDGHSDEHDNHTGKEDHSDEHAQTDDERNHDHGTGDDDPHIWVDPQLALEMARAIAQTLSKLDSTNARAIQQNLQAFEQRLNAREASIREQLEPLQNRKLFSYHSAFTRFAEHYGLQL